MSRDLAKRREGNFEANAASAMKGVGEMSEADKIERVRAVARRILAAAGRPETSDSTRVIYTESDLNIGAENGIIEIVFRGTLVFRCAERGEISGAVFEEHGVWRDALERIAQTIPAFPSRAWF